MTFGAAAAGCGGMAAATAAAAPLAMKVPSGASTVPDDGIRNIFTCGAPKGAYSYDVHVHTDGGGRGVKKLPFVRIFSNGMGNNPFVDYS